MSTTTTFEIISQNSCWLLDFQRRYFIPSDYTRIIAANNFLAHVTLQKKDNGTAVKQISTGSQSPGYAAYDVLRW